MPDPQGAHRAYRQETDLLESEGRTCSATRDRESHFFGMPADDYRAALNELRDEVEARAFLAIVAAAEGLIQRDFRARARARPSVVLAREARSRLRNEGRINVENLLDLWGTRTATGGALGRFRQLLDHRHWLAHGRYFASHAGVPLDPDFAWRRTEELVTELQQVDPDFPRGP